MDLLVEGIRPLPGRHVTDHHMRLYMHFRETKSPPVAAAKASISTATTALWVCREKGPPGSLPRGQGSFFKNVDGVSRLGMMPRPCRQHSVAHGSQVAAQRLLADRHTIFVKQPLDQIYDQPAYHTMRRRDRALLDNLGKRASAQVRSMLELIKPA